MANKVTVSMQTVADTGSTDQLIYFNEPIEINASFTDFSDILTYSNKTHILRYIDGDDETYWRYNSETGNWREIVGISGGSGGDGHMHDNISILDSFNVPPTEEGIYITNVDGDLNLSWSKFIDEIPDMPDQEHKYHLTKTALDELDWVLADELPEIDSETFGEEAKVLMAESDGTISWAGDKIPAQSFIYDSGRVVMEFDSENPHTDLTQYFSDEIFTTDGEKFIIYTLVDPSAYDSTYDKIILFINGFVYSGLLNDSFSDTYVYNSEVNKLLIRIVDEVDSGLYYDAGDNAKLLIIKNTASGVNTRLNSTETEIEAIDIRLTAAESDIDDKADSSDLVSLTSRVSTLEESNVISVDYDATLVSNKTYLCDSSESRTLTLPETPTIGDIITVIDSVGSANDNNITIGLNSKKYLGLTNNISIDTSYGKIQIIYINEIYGWMDL